MKNDNLVQLFTELVEIPSPSGKENNVATYIEHYFKKLDWEVWRDDAGSKNDSDTGNLYAYLEVNKDFETLAFSSHMDTVEKENEQIKVQFDGEILRSDGTTILGADNKAGVATLMGAAADLDRTKLKYNILFFFSTREELGKMGASYFTFEKSKIKYFFNLDEGATPGTFVYKAFGYDSFTITVKGLAAHAGQAYEKGIDAIKASGILLAHLPVGKNTEEDWTLNIGKIEGGHATNVVCDLVTLFGELRGGSDEAMHHVAHLVEATCKEVGETTKATITFQHDQNRHISSFNSSHFKDLYAICETAGKKIGTTATFNVTSSINEANIFGALGYKVITISRGGSNAHSIKEELKLSELKKSVEFVEALIASA